MNALLILLLFALWGTGVGLPNPMIRHSAYIRSEGCKHGDNAKIWGYISRILKKYRVYRNWSCARKWSTKLNNCVRERGYDEMKENNFAINFSSCHGSGWTMSQSSLVFHPFMFLQCYYNSELLVTILFVPQYKNMTLYLEIKLYSQVIT